MPISGGNSNSLSTTRIAAIRAERKRARSKNALIQAPLWATGTAYVSATVRRHSNGELMRCVVSGTSDATTEPTFSATSLMSEASGTAKWAAIGIKSKVNTDGYPVPTITVDGTIPTNAVLNQLWDSALAGQIAAVTVTTAGSGYTPGTYTDVPLTGGSGTGAIARSITVEAGGTISAVTVAIDGTGTGYIYNESLSVNAANVGGTGSGAVIKPGQIWQTKAAWCAQLDAVKTSAASNVYSGAYIYNTGASSGALNNYVRTIEFITDDPEVGIGIHNTSALLLPIWVDDYQIEEAPTPTPAGTTNYYKINWGGVRKERRYKILIQPNFTVKGVAVQPSSTLRAPPDDRLYGVVIGDSHMSTISSYGDLSYRHAGVQILYRAGIDVVRCMSIGSTGYTIGKAENDYNVGALGYSAPAVLTNNPNTDIAEKVQFFVCAHGANDKSTSGVNNTAVATSALATWQRIRAQYPNAIIIVFGNNNSASGPSADHISLDTALAAKFLQWGDSRSFYHSIAQASGGAWFTGTGKWGTTTGTGNSDFYIGSDGAHPSYPGREYLINRMVECIEGDLSLSGY
jgi:hypothetical protein